MRKTIKRLTAYSTWGASSDLTPIDLPRDGLITEITIRANLTATLTAAAYDDWFRRVIQNINGWNIIHGSLGNNFGRKPKTILILVGNNAMLSLG